MKPTFLKARPQTAIIRSKTNQHRYLCFVDGKIRSFVTHEKDFLFNLAALFGQLNAGRIGTIALSVASFLMLASPLAQALPTGYDAVAGDVQFSNPSANTLNVVSNSSKAIVNYQTFNVAGHETVNFLLPSASSSILNRVIGGNPSEILGTINSNGNVFIVNQMGIIFGAGSQINVNSLFASTLTISNSDFLNGNLTFGRAPVNSGAVVNDGTINVNAGGFAILASGAVHNNGSINASLGQVHLAVGDKISLALDNNILADVTVDQSLQQAVTHYHDAISNTGSIKADGGLVSLEAQVKDSFYNRIVNNTGEIQALSVAENNGVIELLGRSDNGNALVNNTGKIDVSGTQNAPNAGTIHADGNYLISSGQILAEGQDQGKGGNIHLTSTQGTQLSSGSITSARGAGANSHAGKVIVWSDKNTYFNAGATLDVSGGSVSGNGGFTEVSGKDTVFFNGLAKGNAVNGKGGSILIDPTDIRITSTGPNSDLTTLISSPDGTLARADANVHSGETRLDPATMSGFDNIALEASQDIHVDSAINLTGMTNSGSEALTLRAGRHININDDITTHGGDLFFYADHAFTGAPSDGVGNINIAAGATLATTGSGADGGEVILRAADVDIQGTIDAGNAEVNLEPQGNQDVYVGGGAVAGAFSVDASELANISGDLVDIGDATETGNLYLNGNLDGTAELSGLTEIGLISGGNIVGNNYSISNIDLLLETTSGNVTNDGTTTGSAIDTAIGDLELQTVSGTVKLNELDDITLSDAMNPWDIGTGTVTITAGNDITVAGEITGNGGRLNLNSDTNITISDNITVTDQAYTADNDNNASGAFTLDAGSTLTSDGSVTITADDVDIQGNIDTSSSPEGQVALIPSTSIAIGIGAAGGQPFHVSTAELRNIQSDSVSIGDESIAGGLTVNGNLSNAAGGALEFIETLILGNNDDITTAGVGDTVTAEELWFLSGNGDVGSSGNPFDINVDFLSVRIAGDAHLDEVNAVVLNDEEEGFAANLTLDAGSSIRVGTFDATNSINLIANDHILYALPDGADPALPPELTAPTIHLEAGGYIGSRTNPIGVFGFNTLEVGASGTGPDGYSVSLHGDITSASQMTRLGTIPGNIFLNLPPAPSTPVQQTVNTVVGPATSSVSGAGSTSSGGSTSASSSTGSTSSGSSDSGGSSVNIGGASTSNMVVSGSTIESSPPPVDSSGVSGGTSTDMGGGSTGTIEAPSSSGADSFDSSNTGGDSSGSTPTGDSDSGSNGQSEGSNSDQSSDSSESSDDSSRQDDENHSPPN
jgi:filamentous hemagglutinin family protein